MTRSYFSATHPTALTSAAGGSDTALYIADGSTYPDPAAYGQYTVIIGYGSDREEVCTVTAKPGVNVLTVTRGEDGTSGTAKNSGDVVVHGVSARDFGGDLPLSGGTLSGPLYLDADPVADTEAANKQYVDTEVAGVLADVASLGLWTPYTPTLAQGASTDISKTVSYAKYTKIGKTVFVNVAVTATGTGTSGSGVTISLPVSAAVWGTIVGSGQYQDLPASWVATTVALTSATTAALLRADAPYFAQVGYDPPFAVAAGDNFSFSFTYESAA